MSWVVTGLAAAGALMGNEKNKRARQVEDADRKLAAETQRYSWVTGNRAEPIRNAGSSLMDIGQGALAGGMFGQQFSGAAKPAPEATPASEMVYPGAKPGVDSMDPNGGMNYWAELEKANRPAKGFSFASR